jgi:cell division protein FtsQ
MARQTPTLTPTITPVADPAPGPDAAEQAVRRTRRRFARRQWRRRWLAWRAVLAALVATALLAGAVWVVWFSSLLTVNAVEITGTDTLKPGQVRRTAGVELGQPMVMANLGAIRTRIAALATVERVEVSRKWPDQVVIDITERTPVAVIDLAGTLHALDKHGVVFRDYAKAPPGLPVVATPRGVSIEALREAAAVAVALPAPLAKTVDHLEVRTIDQISLTLSDGRRVVWGSSADSERKAEVLAVLLNQDAKTYDVSVPGRPTTDD